MRSASTKLFINCDVFQLTEAVLHEQLREHLIYKSAEYVTYVGDVRAAWSEARIEPAFDSDVTACVMFCSV